jgi:hypothetical protein
MLEAFVRILPCGVARRVIAQAEKGGWLFTAAYDQHWIIADNRRITLQ